MSATLNMFDLIFLGLTLIFIVVAFFRGFVKEIFAITNWILSFTICYFLSPFITDFLASKYGNKLAIDVAVKFFVFTVAFITIALSTSSMADAMKEKLPSYMDRSLGVLYALLKTFIVLGFVYSLTLNLYSYLIGAKDEHAPKQDVPTWLQDAKLYNIARIGGGLMDPIVKLLLSLESENINEMLPNLDAISGGNGIKFDSEKPEEADKILDEKPNENAPKENENDMGYNKKDIEKMNRLMEIIDKK